MEENQDKNNFKRQFKNYVFVAWEFLKIAILASIIVLPIRYFIFQPFIVKGESMMPNFQSGDYLIIDQISYKMASLKRGDVVVFNYPLDTTQRYIKRIIGLPGETVVIKDGKITISEVKILEDTKSAENEFTLNEKKYLPNLNNTEGDLSINLLENEYFVLGDNRQFSYDSRKWGVLPKKDIIGRVILRLFPINHLSYIHAPAY